MLQDSSRRPFGTHLGPIWGPFRPHFGTIFEPFWDQKAEQKAGQKAEQTKRRGKMITGRRQMITGT